MTYVHEEPQQLPPGPAAPPSTDELGDATGTLRMLVEQAPVAVIAYDLEGLVTEWNPAAERVLGWSREETLGRTPPHVSDANRLEFDGNQYRTIAQGGLAGFEIVRRRKDGSTVILDCANGVLRDSAGEVVGFVSMLKDVTAEHQARTEIADLETRLHHAQKLEAIGRLAGGVAHDFNNLLTVITGHVELARQRHGDDDDFTQVAHAAVRAAELTRQLLAYGRRQVLHPRPTDVNAAVRELRSMVGRLLGENVALALDLASDLPAVMVDPGQLEQVLLNVVVNARDAMPSGGTVTIATSCLPAGAAGLPAALATAANDWVAIAIVDTGVGMDEQTLELAFEPFFTTKELGQGTGLGLATAYGIVTQSGGEIVARSEPGLGAEVWIYLPSYGAALAPEAPRARPAVQELQGRETILLVEDEEAVRVLLATSLRSYGYTVVEVAGAGEAVARAVGQRLDLVISDVVLPDGSGPEVVTRLRGLPEHAGLRAVFISGYSALQFEAGLPGGCAFLQKPFTGHDLLAVLRSVLDAARA